MKSRILAMACGRCGRQAWTQGEEWELETQQFNRCWYQRCAGIEDFVVERFLKTKETP